MNKKKISIGLIMGLVIIISIIGFKTSASAEITATTYSTGNTTVPRYYQNTDVGTAYSVSNITDKSIDVTMTFYKQDGTIMEDDNSSTTGKIIASSDLLNYCDQNSNSTLTFTLSAHTTGHITFVATTEKSYGYGIVEWKQEGSTQEGLIMNGNVSKDSSNVRSVYAVPINSGLPF